MLLGQSSAVLVAFAMLSTMASPTSLQLLWRGMSLLCARGDGSHHGRLWHNSFLGILESARRMHHRRGGGATRCRGEYEALDNVVVQSSEPPSSRRRARVVREMFDHGSVVHGKVSTVPVRQCRNQARSVAYRPHKRRPFLELGLSVL